MLEQSSMLGSASLPDTLEILIITFNRCPYLQQTLAALLAENSPVRHCPITVLDNASTDDTPTMLAECASRYANLTLRRHPRNIGLSGNVLAALETASRPYFWLLSDDDAYDWTGWPQVADAMAADNDAIVVADYMLTTRSPAETVRQLTFLPAGIYKTRFLTAEVLQNGYYLASTIFPHMGLITALFNQQARIAYVQPALVMNQHNPDSSYVRGLDADQVHDGLKRALWAIGFLKCVQLLNAPDLRDACFALINLEGKSWEAHLTEFLQYQLTVDCYWPNLAELYQSLPAAAKSRFVEILQQIARQEKHNPTLQRQLAENDFLNALLRPALAEAIQSEHQLDVILVTYNRASKLAHMLDKLFDPTSPLRHYPITVLDNGSTDDTPHLLTRYQGQFPHLRVIRHNRNIGGNGNIARAFEVARQPFVWVLCDDDDLHLENWPLLADALASDAHDIIFVANYALTQPDDVAQRVLQATFVPACVYRTTLLDNDTMQNMMGNIAYMFPQLAAFASGLNRGARITVLAKPLITMIPNTDEALTETYIRGRRPETVHPYTRHMFWQIGFVNAIQLVQNPALRQHLIRHVRVCQSPDQKRFFRGIIETNALYFENSLKNHLDFIAAQRPKDRARYVMGYLQWWVQRQWREKHPKTWAGVAYQRFNAQCNIGWSNLNIALYTLLGKPQRVQRFQRKKSQYIV